MDIMDSNLDMPTLEGSLKVQIKRFAVLLKDKDSYDSAYILLLELNKCRNLTSPHKTYLLQLALKSCLQMYSANLYRDCLQWSKVAYNMSKSLQDEKHTSISLSVIMDVLLKTKAWDEVESYVLLFQELNQPLKEHMFKLELCLGRKIQQQVEKEVTICLEHAKHIDDVKHITRIILQSDQFDSITYFCQRLLAIAKSERQERCLKSDSDLAEIYKIVIVLTCDGGILDMLLEALGHFIDWHRRLSKLECQSLIAEFKSIIDHCEKWIRGSLKETTYLSKEAIEVGAQMCAALLLLYNAETETSHVCRTLSHQAQLLSKLKGVEEAKKRMMKIASRQGFPETLTKQILMDIMLENFTFSSASRFNFFLEDKNTTSISVNLKFLKKICKLRTQVSDKCFMREREVILRITVRKFIEAKSDKSNDDEEDELASFIIQTAEELCSKIESCKICPAYFRPWLSQFLYNTGLLIGRSTVFGLAARLEEDYATRQRCRALQLNAIFKRNIIKMEEIEEAVGEILPLDAETSSSSSADCNYERMMFIVLKFKCGLVRDERFVREEVQDLVSHVIRTKDWATLEIFSALLLKSDVRCNTYQKLLFKCLQFSNTIALQEQQVRPFMRTALHLIRTFLAKVDVDSIANIAPQVMTFAQKEATDEVQILMLLMIEELLNFYQRLPTQVSQLPKKHLNLRDELKSIIGSFLGLVPNYNEKFDFLKL